MDVLNLLLSFLLIISFVSGLKQDNITAPICEDNFKNTEGQKINKSDINYICKAKHCITKCCKGKDKFLFVNLREPYTKCYTKTKLLNNFNKTVEFDYSVEVFVGTSEADAKLKTRNLMDYHFVHNTKVMKSDCSSGIEIEPQSYYIFDVSFSTKVN